MWSTASIFFQPVLLDDVHKVGVAPFPEVLGAERDERRVVHAHGAAPGLLLLLLKHLAQRRLAVLQGLQLGAEQSVQCPGVVTRGHRWRALEI